MQSAHHEDSNAQRTQRDGPRRFGRRDALRLGAVATAIGAGAAVLRPQTAGATTGAMQFGARNDAGNDSTALTSANDGQSLDISNTAGAPALSLRSAGAGLVATGGDAGVLGRTLGTGAGVLGVSAAGTGPGVRGEVGVNTATVAAIEAAQSGLGNGVEAHIDNATSDGSALHARTTGTGPGIAASSAHGVGGRFSGATAPIQLLPSSARSHPTKGLAGQLFVDHSNRLWFCKGGTDWRQLA